MPGRQEYREQVERIIRLRNLTDGTIRDYLFMCNRFLDWCESINVSPAGFQSSRFRDYE